MDTFNTVRAQDMIDHLDDEADLLEYLDSKQYFKDFQTHLASLMEEKGIPKKELNKTLGRVNVNNWLSGKVVPNRKNLIRLCFALGLDLQESNLLISKFAGEQKLNPNDFDDAVYYFGLFHQLEYEKMDAYSAARDSYLGGNKRLFGCSIDKKDEFRTFLQGRMAQYDSNKEKKIKILKDVMAHPKVFLGEDDGRGITRPIAEFMYSDVKGVKKSMDHMQKMLKGKLPIRRDDFIKILIACGYCGQSAIEQAGDTVDIDPYACVSEINEKLEEAGFYPLYPRNEKDCIYIATGIQTILNEEDNMGDYLKELSGLFEQMDKKDYIIFEGEESI